MKKQCILGVLAVLCLTGCQKNNTNEPGAIATIDDTPTTTYEQETTTPTVEIMIDTISIYIDKEDGSQYLVQVPSITNGTLEQIELNNMRSYEMEGEELRRYLDVEGTSQPKEGHKERDMTSKKADGETCVVLWNVPVGEGVYLTISYANLRPDQSEEQMKMQLEYLVDHAKVIRTDNQMEE